MFTGIPIEALDFYEDLAADNSKTFWTAHKEIYDTAIRAPITALVTELEAEFGTAKIFRPHRDVRFAKDKSPYKTAQGAVVHVNAGSGYYVQIDAAGLYVGGGFYSGETAQIARFRAAVDDSSRGAELVEILAAPEAKKFRIGGDKLKTAPRGFASEHPRIDILRHKSLTAGREFGAPAWLSTPRTVKEVRASWNAIRPLVDWLGDVFA
ncbi:DUF2461 domain-containing protein [Antrihabitans sp. YC3-6]|uniref:DUF2461 domain-containing protein n=1 Tax=Antrihabitans stalagmiti TaxID=2799499 RepID=A0A934U4E6_9NOCA|nr:DUF2461 domain-containing protein [Antrihabitans stalagmiti]MBJ8340484.1 DUF2461 domain-containing protein [Antrihabitans stalagmiti]